MARALPIEAGAELTSGHARPPARWTPAAGASELARREGRDEAMSLLVALLRSQPAPSDLVLAPYRDAVVAIGDGHAARLMDDPSGERLAYWPRVWAARALAYVGDESVTSSLLAALRDEHPRVRMTAAQTLGRLGLDGHDDTLLPLLLDPDRRVRVAAAVAVGRTGSEDALGPLRAVLDDHEESVRRVANRALASLERRLSRLR